MTNCTTDYNLTDRMVFSESRISRDRRKQRILSSQEYDQAISGAHAVGQLPIYIDKNNFKELDPDMF